jgi:hypothetical protein
LEKEMSRPPVVLLLFSSLILFLKISVVQKRDEEREFEFGEERPEEKVKFR